ncbi:hypothetical protein [Aureliella helgolandensis]|uniref:Uncharacterized protein n=1 Tax=Aureliella helgolandensis TaxID=2527968 RepID=A0A518G277_9BACT|nr:hypothetical protein [Aureliella helgolandensis]QDV22684.1 hypothetical protein Q31a_09700 [Aureliella helgolandensis]
MVGSPSSTPLRPSVQMLCGFLICLLSVAWGQLAFSEERPSAAPQADTTAMERLSDTIESWIGQLDSPAFHEREQASQHLLEIGQPAVLRLQKMGKQSSLESSRRAAEIIASFERETFAALSKKFLTEADSRKSYGLPGWDVFRSVVGTSRTSKLLFLEAVKQQNELMLAIQAQGVLGGVLRVPQAGSNAAIPTANLLKVQDAKAAAQRVMTLANEAALEISLRQRVSSDSNIGDIVALLLAAGNVDQPTPVEISEVVYTNLSLYTLTHYLSKQGFGACLKRLLAGWIPKTHDSFAGRAMIVGLEHSIPEVTLVARKQLKPNTDPPTCRLALQCFLRFGDETDVPQVAAFLEDETTIVRISRENLMQALDLPSDLGIDVSDVGPPGIGPLVPIRREKQFYTVQMNDLALATAMKLSGGSPDAFFANYTADARYGANIYSLALPEENAELRRQYISDWRKAHFPAAPTN